MKALPTSPSLPARYTNGPAVMEHNRRHTTEAAALHSDLLETPSIQHNRHHTQYQTAQGAQEFGDAKRGSNRDPRHAQSDATDTNGGSADIGLRQVRTDARDDNDRSVDLPWSRQHGNTTAAALDLLSLDAQTEEPQHNSYQVNGHCCLSELYSSEFGDYQQSENSDGVAQISDDQAHQLQSHLGASQQSSSWQRSQNSSHVLSKPQQQHSIDNPFQLAADMSHQLSVSGTALSGLSLISDPQGSDLDSWGSFLLPDEPSNLMTDSADSSQQLPLSLPHTTMAGLPALGSGFSKVSEDLSPHSLILSKQHHELELFSRTNSAK